MTRSGWNDVHAKCDWCGFDFGRADGVTRLDILSARRNGQPVICAECLAEQEAARTRFDDGELEAAAEMYDRLVDGTLYEREAEARRAMGYRGNGMLPEREAK